MNAVKMTPTDLKANGLTVLMAAVLFTPNAAMAAHLKTYSGAECTVTESDYPEAFYWNNRYFINPRGGIVNMGSGESGLRVTCPAHQNGNSDITAKMYVVDGSSLMNISCTLKSVSITGVLLGTSKRESTSVSPDIKVLAFSSAIKTERNANLFFDCTIPPYDNGYSEIISYQVDAV